jgi:hypothetical protein
MDATGHERLFLFRDIRIGSGFCGSRHPDFFASVSGCEERIPSHGKLGVLGGGLCDPSIIVAASLNVVYARAQHVMSMKHTLVTAVLFIVASASYGSKVVPQKLEEMISSVNVIVIATIQKAEKVSDTSCYRYAIEVTNVLAGELAAKRLSINYWQQGSPRFSVFVPASGIEAGLKEGRRYVLLFESVTDQGGLGIVLTRAEPEQRRDAVLKAWQEWKRKDKKGANKRAAGQGEIPLSFHAHHARLALPEHGR